MNDMARLSPVQLILNQISPILTDFLTDSQFIEYKKKNSVWSDLSKLFFSDYITNGNEIKCINLKSLKTFLDVFKI